MNGQQILHFDFYALAEITRFGVPIFLMITGSLLLNREIELKSFFKKKFIRIVYPFLFFLIIHIIFLYPSQFNLFGYNWYFWMIIGVYLAIPIINRLIQNLSSRELDYFILLIFIASIIYQLFNFFNIKSFLDLSFFIGPISYLILGYYLSRKEFNMPNNKIITLCLILFVAITLLKMFGVLGIIPETLVMNFKSTNTDITLSWLDVGFFELIQTASVFIFVKQIYKSENSIFYNIKRVLELNYFKKFIISVSKASYGMYLINRTLMLYCDNYIANLFLSGKEMCIYFLILTIGIFFTSWIIIVILSKIPFIKRFSGYA